jgi:hypothetical protein
MTQTHCWNPYHPLKKIYRKSLPRWSIIRSSTLLETNKTFMFRSTRNLSRRRPTWPAGASPRPETFMWVTPMLVVRTLRQQSILAQLVRTADSRKIPVISTISIISAFYCSNSRRKIPGNATITIISSVTVKNSQRKTPVMPTISIISSGTVLPLKGRHQ